MRLILVFIGLHLVPPTVAAQERYERATRIGTVDSLWSATLDEYRPYLVYTPPSYDGRGFVPSSYPVLYLLDGDAHFHSVSGLAQILGTGINGTYAVPEMIVVAIPNTNRTRDLTPTKADVGFDGRPTDAFASSGGGANFLAFLRDELIPHVGARYRTLPYRILVGHSFGGITALNALYEIPETFNAYVAIDPSLWWDDQVLLKKAKEYFSAARLEKRALYVAQANTINPDDTTANPHFSAITQFDAIMKAYDESGLRYAFRYYDEDDHGSVPLIAEYDALRFIFDGYRVPLQRVMGDPGLLAQHFDQVSERLGAPFAPSEALVVQLTGFTMAQDTAKALAFVAIGEGLYPTSHNWPEFRGDVAAARGETERARAFYEDALAKTDDVDHIREKLEKLEQPGW